MAMFTYNSLHNCHNKRLPYIEHSLFKTVGKCWFRPESNFSLIFSLACEKSREFGGTLSGTR